MTRYYKKCERCDGQGVLRVGATRFNTAFITCPNCIGGYVDCTDEIEALKAKLEALLSEGKIIFEDKDSDND